MAARRKRGDPAAIGGRKTSPEVTRAMITAGIDAYVSWNQMAWREDGSGQVSYMVASVYRAMLRAAREDEPD